jgi:hypothetical protein
MEKRWHKQRESRHARSRQLRQEESDHQRLRNKGILATSQTEGNDRNGMGDEGEHRPRPAAPSISPQDDYVQRWLAQTTHEVGVSSNAGLGSRKENGRSVLAIPINVLSCLSRLRC